MSMAPQSLDLVLAEIRQARASKGLPDADISTDSVLLGESLELDSLDLAMIVVSLEEQTGMTPFRDGFVMFRTVGELANLFSKG